ncbi:hypothetical protein [uncultured Sphingomonas sp.]|uniref:hypothetical protein n=1 Tax=uncultured Sphingomonas sp. TaxID=158754 RepID=UPI0025F28A69|nr:hypothetical protein [uncultured Sphingomonas sp.]
MRITTIPVLDAPLTDLLVANGHDEPTLVRLHRDVLTTIRQTISNCAHPSCLSCHELAVVLDNYLLD